VLRVSLDGVVRPDRTIELSDAVGERRVVVELGS
jgi:hypothetical protein